MHDVRTNLAFRNPNALQTFGLSIARNLMAGSETLMGISLALAVRLDSLPPLTNQKKSAQLFKKLHFGTVLAYVMLPKWRRICRYFVQLTATKLCNGDIQPGFGMSNRVEAELDREDLSFSLKLVSFPLRKNNVQHEVVVRKREEAKIAIVVGRVRDRRALGDGSGEERNFTRCDAYRVGPKKNPTQPTAAGGISERHWAEDRRLLHLHQVESRQLLPLLFAERHFKVVNRFESFHFRHRINNASTVGI